MAGAWEIARDIIGGKPDQPFFYECEIKNIRSVMPAIDHDDFADFLGQMKRSDLQIRLIQDGSLIFPHCPVMQVSGPLSVVRLLETAVCGILNSLVPTATVAARIRSVTPSKITLIEMGTRRTHPSGSASKSLAAYIGGFDATSNVEAAIQHGINVTGTMAHSHVLSYGPEGEMQSFKDFLRAFPTEQTLLVDTYDVEQGVCNAIRASLETTIPLHSIRIDSDPMDYNIKVSRNRLNQMGLHNTRIVVSNDMDEYKISNMDTSNINTLGCGTRVFAPTERIGFVFKIVEVAGASVAKKSLNKTNYPGVKEWFSSTIGGHYSCCVLPKNRVASLSLPTDSVQMLTDPEYTHNLQSSFDVTPGSEYIDDARKMCTDSVASLLNSVRAVTAQSSAHRGAVTYMFDDQ